MPRMNLNHAARLGLMALFFCLGSFSADKVEEPLAPIYQDNVSTYFWNRPRRVELMRVSKEQSPKRVRIHHVLDDEEWLSSVLFGRPDFYPKSNGVVIMVPGMGGNVAKYGVAFSTKKFAEVALDLNLYPVAVQNRVYQGALDPNFPIAERWKIAEILANLNFEMGEHYGMINRVTDDPRKKKKPCYLYGRSNGSAKNLQMVHNMTEGDDAAIEAGQKVEAILVAGVNTHRSPGFEIWTGAEDMENEADKTDVDEVAKWVDREQYKQMTWDNDGLFQTTKAVKFPKVVFIISKQDHYVPLALQIETAQNFAKRHPQVQVEILYTPTRHDPTASFVVPGTGLVHNGQFLKAVMENHFHPNPLANRISEVRYPHYDAVAECPLLIAYPHIPTPLADFVRQAALKLNTTLKN